MLCRTENYIDYHRELDALVGASSKLAAVAAALLGDAKGVHVFKERINYKVRLRASAPSVFFPLFFPLCPLSPELFGDWLKQCCMDATNTFQPYQEFFTQAKPVCVMKAKPCVCV